MPIRSGRRLFTKCWILCFGSATELRHDRHTLGDEAALELVRKRWQGLQRLRSTFGDAALGHRVCGSVELFPSSESAAPPSAHELADLNQWIQPVTGVADTFTTIPTHSLPHLHVDTGGPTVLSRLEGLLDTGKMNRAFRSLAQAKTIDLLTGIRVDSMEVTDNTCALKISTLSREESTVRPKRLLIATNALAVGLIPELDVQPAVNHVLVTDRIRFRFCARGAYRCRIHLRAAHRKPHAHWRGRHWDLDETATRNRLRALSVRCGPLPKRRASPTNGRDYWASDVSVLPLSDGWLQTPLQRCVWGYGWPSAWKSDGSLRKN